MCSPFENNYRSSQSMIKNIPDIFDILAFKLLFGVVIGIPIIGFGMYFGVIGVVSLFAPVILIFNEPSVSYDLEYTLKTLKFIIPLMITGFFGISGLVGACDIAIRIHKTYKKLPNNHIQTIRFMLLSGQYACLGGVGEILLFVEFEEFKKIIAGLVFFLFSFIVFNFCIRATPKRL